MNVARLTPDEVSAPCRKRGKLALGFGRRFIVLLLLGTLWTLLAFWERQYLYAMIAWDAVLLLAWAADGVRLPRREQLIITRSWQGPLSLAEDAVVELKVNNQGGTTVECELFDDLPPALVQDVQVVRVVVGAHGEAAGTFKVHPLQRGDIATGIVVIRYRSRLQLCERWAEAQLKQVARVYPSLDEARKQTLYLTRSRQIEMEKRLLRQRGMGREFESLREYRQGDELRDVSWTASGRRGKLVTKLYQVERSQPVWIVMDCGRLLRARIGEISKLDHAINAAVSLAQIAIHSGDKVGVLAYGRAPQCRIGLGRGPAHLRQIIDSLSSVQPEAPEADHLRAAAVLRQLQRRRALVIWITDLAETAATPEVIEGASQLLSQHLVLFVAIAQPDLNELAQREPADMQQMYETVAAQEMVQRREVLLAQLRDRGSFAVEVSAGKLSAAVVNQYLHIKEQNLI